MYSSSGRLGDRDRDRRTSGPGRRRSPHRSPSHRSPGSTAASRDKDKDAKDSDTKESKEAADGDSKDNKDKDNKDKKEKDVLDFEKIKVQLNLRTSSIKMQWTPGIMHVIVCTKLNKASFNMWSNHYIILYAKTIIIMSFNMQSFFYVW